jgi:CelD/BcsL family acetyltransferase involved in cellulose biosynthesis
MFEWKSVQYVSTGQPDILARPWIKAVHQRVHDFDGEDFGGVMFTVRAGGEVAAAMLGLRNKTKLHAWMIAYNPDFAKYSPGNLIWFDMMNKARENGIDHIDFGAGLYDYKKFFANGERVIGGGFAGRPSMATLARGAMFGVRGWAERQSNEKLAALPGKAMRKIDLWRGMTGCEAPAAPVQRAAEPGIQGLPTASAASNF